ncbi:hypothetical protein FOC1_g10016359 [Fusarium oxysporum f. sp. cubense race 1]|uniref:Uncharacterized protein n=1 Tax=Fusarium oxysporum f. sp. cubense (strain race 1) TaxID=1229664 RepID=N4TVA4_FUSC1|nr:hypothetical protein FOC1_g10016359 [Fusarium oxysporum f. sp. cubense race 1]
MEPFDWDVGKVAPIITQNRKEKGQRKIGNQRSNQCARSSKIIWAHTVPTINQGPPLLGPCFFGKTSNLTGINACLAWSRQFGKLSFLASSLVCGTEC